jgi:hypothetical protein
VIDADDVRLWLGKNDEHISRWKAKMMGDLQAIGFLALCMIGAAALVSLLFGGIWLGGYIIEQGVWWLIPVIVVPVVVVGFIVIEWVQTEPPTRH